MCWCNKNIRTPCCGGVSCHPFPSDGEYSSFIEESRNHIIETAHQNPSNTYDILIKNSQLQLWQSYTDKKQECEILRDMLKECSILLTQGTEEHCRILAGQIEEYLKEV